MVTNVQNNISNISQNPPPIDPAWLIQEYKDLYINFCKDPSQANAQALLNFMKNNQTQLDEAAAMIGYAPYPGANPSDDISALINSLTAFTQGAKDIDAVYEFANDVRQWLGVNLTPQDILEAFESYAQKYINSSPPSAALAAELKWILSVPGFVKALSGFSKDPDQFSKDVAQAESDLSAGKNAQADIAKILADLS